MSLFGILSAPFSAIGNLVGGAFQAIASPISDLFGFGQINAMTKEFQKSEDQLMKMSTQSLQAMQTLFGQSIANANSYASALGKPGISNALYKKITPNVNGKQLPQFESTGPLFEA